MSTFYFSNINRKRPSDSSSSSSGYLLLLLRHFEGSQLLLLLLLLLPFSLFHGDFLRPANRNDSIIIHIEARMQMSGRRNTDDCDVTPGNCIADPSRYSVAIFRIFHFSLLTSSFFFFFFFFFLFFLFVSFFSFFSFFLIIQTYG